MCPADPPGSAMAEALSSGLGSSADTNEYKDMAVPSERTLQRWFKARQLYKPKSRFPLLPSPAPAHQVHEVWQIDAKEKLHLGTGQKASYLSIVDEKSGSLLRAEVFPPLPHQ